MKDILIIYNSVSYFVPFMEEKGYTVSTVFKEIPAYLRIIRRIAFQLNLPFKKLWFKEWACNLDSFSKVIFFSTNPIDGLQYIKKTRPDLEVVYWYWNPIFKSLNPAEIYKLEADPWAFDEYESKKYGIKFNTTFYLDNIKIEQLPKEYDVLFLGLDKGRGKSLREMESKLNESGVSTHFYIVDDGAHLKNYKGLFPFVSYDNYLLKLSKAIALIDLNQEGQRGLTLRPMEAMFLGKKLITDNMDIINMDFYDPNNIFVLGVDKFSNLKHFLESPIKDIDSKIIARYDINNWITRFENKQ